jgi:hypothetical protein
MKPMKRTLPYLVAVGVIAGQAAWAQEAIPTAAGPGAPPVGPASASPTMISDRASMHDDRGPVPIGPCGKPYQDDGQGGLKQDKKPTGEVWGAVGTHGYHDVGAAVCIPAGKNTAVSIAIDQSQYNWGRRR